MSEQGIVLVGVDGSEESFNALKWAIDRVKKTHDRLHIICVYSLPSFTPSSLEGGYAAIDDMAIREGAQVIINQALDKAKAEGIEATSSTEVGDPARILVELSNEVSMIVVGKSGVGGFADRLLGSVSSALASHAVCEVVVVPSTEEEKTYGNIEKIVVGVDCSKSSLPALKSAIYETKLYEADLTAIMTVPIATGTGVLAWLPAAVDKESILQDVAQSLNEVVDEYLQGSDLEVTRYALDGNPASVLTDFSTMSDLVVVGTRGRGGFTGLLLGSTSQTLLNNSKCPVLIVPSMVTVPDIFKEKE